MKKSVLLLLVLMLSSIVSVAQKASLEARRARLHEVIDQVWEYELKTVPENATQIGDTRYNDQVSDISPEFYASDLEQRQKFLAALEYLDVEGFSEQEQLNRQLQMRSLREDLEAGKFNQWKMPFDQMNGIQLQYASLPASTTFSNAKDYNDYISRLRKIPSVIQQAIYNARLGMKIGMMPPAILMPQIVAQVDSVVKATDASNPFAAPVKAFPATISQNDQPLLRAQVMRVVRQDVIPAYAALGKFLREEYTPKGRPEPGVWSIPAGDAYYAFKVRQQTTTNLSPEEIHQLGLKQVASIEAEMTQLAAKLGFKDIQSLNQHVRADRKLYSSTGPQLLGLYQKYTDQMYAELPKLFTHLPKNKLVVVPMEAFRSPSGMPADYSAGSPESGRPGRINVNEYDPQHRLLLNLEAIAYHEGVPGHHLQIAIAQEQESLPAFRKYAGYTAYVEGWALYSERLAKEVGFYQDPYSDYGRLQNEMWRAIRLVIDTGVHSKHWTRQQMVDYFHKYTAMDEPNIQTEVDRYIADPGQALAYKIGQKTILDLREQAKAQLGAAFDLRAFHDELLSTGPLPMDTLTEHMTAWIAAQKSSNKNTAAPAGSN